MKDDTRIAIGFMGIVLGILMILLPNKTTIVPTHYETLVEVLPRILLLFWFVSSMSVKLIMIINRKASWLNIVSLVIFLIALFLPSSPHSRNNPITPITDMSILIYTTYLGWFVIDFLDLVLKKQPNDNKESIPSAVE